MRVITTKELADIVGLDKAVELLYKQAELSTEFGGLQGDIRTDGEFVELGIKNCYQDSFVSFKL